MNKGTTPDASPAFTPPATGTTAVGAVNPLEWLGIACCGAGGALFYDLTKNNLSGSRPRTFGDAAQVPATET